MIPKIIHQIWVGPYKIPSRELRIMEDLKNKHHNYTHYFWTDYNLPEIPERLKEMYKKMYDQEDYVFCADMLRWIVVRNHGGWYLDIDWECITSLENLNLKEKSGIVFGHWGEGWLHCDYTITNNVFAFEKNHEVTNFFVDEMPVELGYCNGPYSPGWCGVTIKKYLGLKNEFSNEIWEYHRVMREKLNLLDLDYGDYNTFQNTILKHYALYSWSHENKEKFKKGEIS